MAIRPASIQHRNHFDVRRRVNSMGICRQLAAVGVLAGRGCLKRGRAFDGREVINEGETMTTATVEHLIDHLLAELGLKNDAALARRLEVAPPVISKLRAGRLPLGASMLLRMHEESGIAFKELREHAGLPPFVSTYKAAQPS